MTTRTTTTNEQGYYSFEFAPVGMYSVTVEQPGFQRVTKTGIQVNINQAVRTDFKLAVGAISQSVTVQAEATAIKTDDATVSEIIPERAIMDTPLNGRQREYADAVRRSGETLLGIVNDILDSSKMKAGKLELEASDLDVRAVAEDVVGLFAAQAQEKGLERIELGVWEFNADAIGFYEQLGYTTLSRTMSKPLGDPLCS